MAAVADALPRACSSVARAISAMELVDDAHDLADLLRARGELAQGGLRFVDGLLDAMHAVDRAGDRFASFVRRVLHVARELARASRRLPDLLGRGVHLHHRARGLD